ncbi:MAG: YggU family protein [Alphaproteobacteria bacterium]|nr:YggU family protein [Alphaproteobacteria bacterium]
MNKCRLQIRVQPNAKRSEWAGVWNGTHYKIALHAPAVDGKANEALIDFLSDYLKVPKRFVVIVSGQTNRCKTIEIQGLTQEQLSNTLGHLSAK